MNFDHFIIILGKGIVNEVVSNVKVIHRSECLGMLSSAILHDFPRSEARFLPKLSLRRFKRIKFFVDMTTGQHPHPGAIERAVFTEKQYISR